MDQAKFKVAYVITERGDKTFWNRIGVAFTNKDGSINVKLDALPTSGQLQIRDYEARDEADMGTSAGALRGRSPHAAGLAAAGPAL
jgi:hypothetical protein